MAISATKLEGIEEKAEAGVSKATLTLAFLESLLLSVWLGSMMFFSFAVAPSAFAVLPTRHLAGQMVQSTLAKVEVLGLVIGLLLMLIQLAGWRQRRHNRARWLRFGLLGLMVGATALSRFWVSPALNLLRGQMGGVIDDVAATDPLRLQFNDLHQYSVWLMGTAMLAGIALIFFTLRAWMKRPI